MKYRLMFKSNVKAEETEMVLTQVMNNFNASFPAVISIKAFLLQGTDLWAAMLSDEIEIEFEHKQISKIGALTLEETIDFEKDFTIDFNFLETAPVSSDVLDAQYIEV
jgi:hypothetical protein